MKGYREGMTVRHFKGKEYVIMTLSEHTETGEILVIYKESMGRRVFARPLGMFISKVDKDKYPEIEQEYRFEKI